MKWAELGIIALCLLVFILVVIISIMLLFSGNLGAGIVGILGLILASPYILGVLWSLKQ